MTRVWAGLVPLLQWIVDCAIRFDFTRLVPASEAPPSFLSESTRVREDKVSS